ncbi:hypothetical protein GCM10010300_64130 [Streptomyces olivaceoviridis]|nr:hypothetical protein GCM10010300_64130 [Streptomyces olivaceoviridis]
MASQTFQHGVTLRDLLAYQPPQPKTGCRTCDAMARDIERLDRPGGSDYDPSKASDLRVKLSRHQKSGC